MQAISLFRVVLLDSTDTAVAEITTALSVNTVDKLDAIGRLTLTLPVNDPNGYLIDSTSRIDVYDYLDGYLGRYYFASSDPDDKHGIGTRTIEFFDTLTELTRVEVGFNRKYTNHQVSAAVVDLIGLLAESEYDQWGDPVVDAAIGITTVAYENVSVFTAVDELRKRFGQHFRLNGVRKFEFGAFGEDSGLRGANLDAPSVPVLAQSHEVFIIDDLTPSESAEEIVNVVWPVGAGEGLAKLTIEQSTAYPEITNTTATDQDSTTRYGLTDQDSVDAYGYRGRVITFPNLRPVNNNEASIILASDALKLGAYIFLQRHKDPRKQYRVVARNLSPLLKIGDKVHIQYRQVHDGQVYMDVDEKLYVMEIQRTRSASGDRRATLIVAPISEVSLEPTDVIVETVKDMRALKLNVRPNATTSSFDSWDTISANPSDTAPPSNPRKAAKFSVFINRFFTTLLAAELRFVTEPPISVTQYDGTDNFFLTEQGTEYPSDIYLFINDEDVTTELGGPWAAGGASTAVDETVDITAILLRAATIYQRHTIEFRCLGRNGNVATPSNSNPTKSGAASQGIVRMNLAVLATTQPILSE